MKSGLVSTDTLRDAWTSAGGRAVVTEDVRGPAGAGGLSTTRYRVYLTTREGIAAADIWADNLDVAWRDALREAFQFMVRMIAEGFEDDGEST